MHGALTGASTRSTLDYLIPAFLAALWFAFVLAIDPRGEFPIIDDWSYARTVRTLLEQHRLEYDGWNSPILFLQAIYGALFSLPFGFSFTTLRASTLVLGLVGVVGLYATLRRAGASEFWAAVGGLVLLCNSLYLQHSFTFMTDVPFLSLQIASAVFYTRAFSSDRPRHVIAGTVLACCATLVRDIGLVLPMAFGFAYFATRALNPRTLLITISPFFATAIVFIGYYNVIEALNMTPAMHGVLQRQIAERFETLSAYTITKDIFVTSVSIFSRLAFFMFPLLILTLPSAIARMRSSWWASYTATVMALFAYLYLTEGWRRPAFGPFEMWPHMLLNGGYWVNEIKPSAVLREFLFVAEAVAAATLAWLLVTSVVLVCRARWVGNAWVATTLFAFAGCVILIAPLALYGSFFPRYVLPLIPFTALLLVPIAGNGRLVRNIGWQQRLFSSMATVVVTLYGVVAVAAVHDYLAWNRTRLEAVDYLLHEKKLSPHQIDAGFEWSGWYLFPAAGPLRDRFINFIREEPTWYYNEQAEYVVLFATEDDPYARAAPTVIWRKEFVRWVPGPRGAIEIRMRELSARPDNEVPAYRIDRDQSAPTLPNLNGVAPPGKVVKSRTLEQFRSGNGRTNPCASEDRADEYLHFEACFSHQLPCQPERDNSNDVEVVAQCREDIALALLRESQQRLRDSECDEKNGQA